MIRNCSLLLLPLLLLSCEMEKSMDETMVKAPDVQARFGTETKTVLSTDAQGNGTVSWLSGEKINVFFNTTGIAYTSSNTETTTETTFTTDGQVTIKDLESGNVWALYPFDASAQSDGNHITTRLSNEQRGVAGTFDTNFYPLLAHSSTTDLSFYNVCGGIKFSLSRSDIYKVVLRSNAEETLAGRVSLSMNGGRPRAEVLSGDSVITLTPKDGAAFQKDQDYYIVCLPGTLSQGFQMDFYSMTGKKATYKKDESFTVKRAVFAKKEHIDEGVDEWADNPEMTGGKRSGLYLGITGFNQELYTYPITRLNEVTISDFNAFVNGLQMKNGSLLCYGVDQSIDRLKEAVFPDDLCAVALVTFTDGLDQGSVMMNPAYGSEETYLDAIQNRIQDENISNHHIMAYSVGMKGSDVSDVVKFRHNLQKLASSSDNAFEVNSMSEVNSRLQAIAKKVTAISYIYDFSITIPGQSDATRVRFTFDNASDAANSSAYIEGTFRLGDYSLHDVTYHGLSSTSGNTIRGNVNGIFVTFAFDSVRIDKGRTLESGSIAQWAYVSSTGKWQVNSEFDANQNMDIEVTKQSVAVMLVLDCSNSLDNQYYTMLSHARSFIRALQEASYDPYAVSSVRLDQTTRTVYVGDSFPLKAIVGPDTARDKSVLWTTSDPEVAAVDQEGLVTAVGPGSAVVTATTMDGGYTANCNVTVKPVPVTGVSLDKSSVTLIKGEGFMLTATVSPENASNKSVTWTSSKTEVALVDETGRVSAVSEGSATITVATVDGNKKATCAVTVIPRGVDLGLSVIWAAGNIGAASPEEYGDYYAWGETEPKENYSWSTYKFGTSSSGPFSKYNTNSSYGTVDNKTVLESEDDVAHVKLGANWRMPTDAEWEELRIKCTWTRTNDYNGTGVKGRIVTATNGNSIFLPAAGDVKYQDLNEAGSDGYYWSSSLTTGSPSRAWDVYFYPDADLYVSRGSGYRFLGLSVRPVFAIRVESIALSQTSLELIEGGSATLIATVTPTDATNKSVNWTSSDTSVATVDEIGKVKAISKGTATIKAEANDGSGVFASCAVRVKEPYTAVAGEAVDLGLSVKWSSMNLGAMSPSDYGDYFAWGETEPKDNYIWATYKLCNGSSSTLTKYNNSSSHGTVDNKTEFKDYDYVDDAARQALGGEWRIPTDAEWTELREQCTWEWTSNYNGTGIAGRIVTSKKTGYTDKSIFLPAAGRRYGTNLDNAGSYGFYWSSFLDTDRPRSAWNVYFGSDYVGRGGDSRYCGQSVRPVSE